ncbi:MAG: sulfatase-like hydrolase/transferase, partial [Acidimicrobiia bacterium]|nr:sulfatase-like hydrolase/transferase [Acidimicrobiia bacterium]
FPLERTVVAFTSDHGDYAGHRGLGGKSPWIPFDDLVRVPLVLAGFGIAPDRTSEALVQSSDLPLTFCDLAGVPLPVDESEFDSCSLTPHLGGAPPVGIGDRAARFLFNAGWPGARLGTAKLICHWPSWTTMLFDLDQDPDETVDVSADPAYADTRRELESIVWDGIFRDPPAGLIDWVASEASSEAAR